MLSRTLAGGKLRKDRRVQRKLAKNLYILKGMLSCLYICIFPRLSSCENRKRWVELLQGQKDQTWKSGTTLYWQKQCFDRKESAKTVR